jgi:hypothetical protein
MEFATLISLYRSGALLTLYVVAAPLLLVGVPLLTVLAIIYLKRLRRQPWFRFGRIYLNLVGALALSFSGMTVGFLTGVSRAPAVTALIPGVLTFVGAFGLYLVGVKGKRATPVAVVVILFSVFVVFGSLFGASYRYEFELTQLRAAAAREQEDAIANIEREAFLDLIRLNIRKSLSLPDTAKNSE